VIEAFRHTSAFLLISMGFLLGCGIQSHPSDRAMIEVLRTNRQDFDLLVKMLGEDQDVKRLDQKFVFLTEDSDRVVAEDRLAEYRRLFKKLELDSGIYRDKDGSIRLIASSKSSLLSTSEKSFVYSSKPRSNLVDSLDKVIKNDGGDHAPVYKEVGDNWYLYYESW